ncbi:MAG: 50S ribosomal protein L22 [Bdellovibrionales bacterium]|nr:50S ribosomal protein L22 [Bdellovibrionales bacterium]
MEVKATLRFVRVGAQKARLVADLVRGKDVNSALKELTFLEKKTAGIIKKLIESAVANAEQKQSIDVDNLYVKTITVDGGPMYKRWMPRAQGRATPILKKSSHINVILDER